MQSKQLEIQDNLNKATKFLASNDFIKAINSYEQVLKDMPNNFHALYNLAVISNLSGKHDIAASYANKASHIECFDSDKCKQIGNILFQAKQYKNAYEYMEKISHDFPDNPEILYMLGLTCNAYKKFDQAIISLEKALDNFSNQYKTLIALGKTYQERALSGDDNKALEYFKLATEYNPSRGLAYIKIANIYRKQGKFDKAISYYQQTLEKDPENISAYFYLSRLKKFTKDEYDFISKPISILIRPDISWHAKRTLNFTLAKFYDDLGNYDKAMFYYNNANMLLPNHERSSLNEFRKVTEDNIQTFSSGLFNEKFNFGLKSDLPIFIVGMPRSGTTLVEQIISSHSKITGLGELDKIKQLYFSIKKPVNQLSEEEIKNLANEYINHIKQIFGKNKLGKFTDKLPLNFQHIGLIKLIFPKAKIINCQRDPLDICISTYRQHFNTNISIYRDLKEIALMYKDYVKAMNYWHKLFPGQIYDIAYEDIIANPEEEIRKVIEFLEVKWDKSCLEFYKNPKSVTTASDTQIREPIYKSSVGRWKNYETHLAEIKRLIR